ncbi:SpoIIE family protein phosphatase [Streptomyces sp. YKOK-I1]
MSWGTASLYAVYAPVTGTCTRAPAGHPPPVLLTPDGIAQVVDAPVGPPLGYEQLVDGKRLSDETGRDGVDQ